MCMITVASWAFDAKNPTVVCDYPGAHQPAHLHSLISVFGVHILTSLIAYYVTCKIAIF